MQTEVRELVAVKLDKFEEAIKATGNLEIDSVIEGTSPREDKFKILNHKMEAAFEIDVEAVVKQEISDVIESLTTGECIKLHGVTRIVGYYSRIQTGWNKSKIGELRDRRQGNYWEEKRTSEKLVGLGV